MTHPSLALKCPLCNFDLSKAAVAETDTGTSLSCRCDVCGWLVFAPGAVDAVARLGPERRRALFLRALSRTDTESVLFLDVNGTSGSDHVARTPR